LSRAPGAVYRNGAVMDDFDGPGASVTYRRVRPARLLFGCVALLAISALSSEARASGISLGKFGGVYGHANSNGGLALYYNPARLSLDEGLYGTLDVSVVLRSATYDRVIEITPTTTPDEVRYNSGEATLATVGVLPLLAAGYTGDLGDMKLGGAVGVFPTFGGIAEWDKKESSPTFPGVVDGPQRWANIGTSFVVLHYTAGVSATFEQIGLGLGASIGLVSAQIDTVRARNLNETDALVDSSGVIQEGRAHFDGSDTDFALSFGASLEQETITAGLNVRPGFELDLQGPIRQAYATNPPTTEDGRLNMALPTLVNAAVTPVFWPFEITAAAEYAGWSAVEAHNVFDADTGAPILEIPRKLEDTIGVKLIPGWHFDEHWMAALMLGYETSSVPTETLEPGFMDAPKLHVGLGGRLELEHVKVSVSWHRDQFFEVEADDSIQAPAANGTYNDHRDFFNVTVEGRL
jgi:long-chain fatty acid transport protein